MIKIKSAGDFIGGLSNCVRIINIFAMNINYFKMIKSIRILNNTETEGNNFPPGLYMVNILVIGGSDI